MELPLVSVVVPVYNDEKRIGRCIEALLDQSYPKASYEIIVVDNGSSDGTTKEIQKYPVTLLVEAEVKGPAAARNRGIKQSKGNIIAFTDSDAKASNSWLKNGIEALLEAGADYAGGNVEIFYPNDNVSYWDSKSVEGVFPVEDNIRNSNFAPACNIFVKKSVIEKVGLFDERLVMSEDVEFGQRIKEAGFKQIYTKEAIIYHPTRSTLRDYVRWAFRTGKGKVQLAKYYPEKYKKLISGFWNPKKYLPPAPWKFGKNMEGYESMTFKNKCSIYMLTYIKNVLLPLGVLVGVVSESLHRSRESKVKDNES